MAPDDLRKRLSELNRGRLLQRDRPKPMAAERSPVLEPRDADAPRVERASVIPLAEVAPGEVVKNQRGQFLRIVRRLEDLTKQSAELGLAHTAIFDRGEAGIDRDTLRPDLACALESRSDRLLFMDLETTGLGGSPLFLVGLMHFDRDTFVIEQLLARDYSEEAAILRHYHDLSRRFHVLVTFNGKSFDVPQITDRSFVTGVKFEPLTVTHVDLLHESRRHWRGKFPNFKLQTLETLICRRLRSGDIPGDQIPQAYHDFVRSGNACQMKDIVHHNALDLLTMAQLLLTMLGGKRV